jgi:hypothetical protein
MLNMVGYFLWRDFLFCAVGAALLLLVYTAK